MTHKHNRRCTRGFSVKEKLQHYVEEGDGGCWLWTGALVGGYGVLQLEGRLQKAHRLSYAEYVGPIPDGLTIDHLCRVKRCIRPEHLEPVTSGENTRRHHDGRCKKGHVMDKLTKRGKRGPRRYCSTCRSEYLKKRRAERAKSTSSRLDA